MLNIHKLLNTDYYKGVNSIEFQKALRKIKPFAKHSMDEIIPLSDLEKLVAVYEYKYSVQVDYIHPVFLKGEKRMYSVVIRNTDTKDLYPTIFSSSIYEAFVKVSLFYYNIITEKQEVGLKDWSKVYAR